MIGIIDYNMGNIQSVVNALEFIGSQIKVITKAEELVSVDKIILPGVGAFGVGIDNLQKLGMIEVLNREVLDKKKPFLGICLGMQLICKESFEFGQFQGLGWIDASVRKFEEELNVRIPHVGWNNLITKKQNKIIEEKESGLDVYFVHSYYVDIVDSSMVTATCEYGREFVAAIEKENIFAIQFHPEKSQKVGLKILKSFSEVNLECLKSV